MKSKLFNKFFFSISAIIIVSFTIIFATISFVVSHYFSNEKYSLLDESCNSVSRIVSVEFNSSSFNKNIYYILRSQKDVSNSDIFICDKNGNIIICCCDEFLQNKKCFHTNTVINKEIINTVKAKGIKEIGTLNNLYDDKYYCVGKPIIGTDGEIKGYTFASASTKSLKNLLVTIRKMSLVACLVPIVITFFVLFSLTYRFSKPLKSMSEAAKRMSRGDFSKRIPVISDDEIGQLSVSFNYMTDSLSKLEQMRRSFIGNVSHELRTPMTTIAGFIDGIIDGTIDEENREHYLNIVSTEIKRLSRVVESMLNIAELESGAKKITPTRFSLSEAIINILISREQAVTQKEIDIVGLDTLPNIEVCADYDLMYQAIYNLIDNAVKFTDNGGTITFKMIKKKDNVQFSIQNTGAGISKDGITHVFERFYKTDKARSSNVESTGIGLFIVKNIIDIHGGKILAESKENEYTVFKVMLPLNCSTEDNVDGRK